MAESTNGRRTKDRVLRANTTRFPTVPLQSVNLRTPPKTKYDWLDHRHKVHRAWYDRWEANEARLAGQDEVLEELRAFPFEKDMSPFGNYAMRQREAIYTNFPEMYATAITGHLLRFAPKPDAGWGGGNLGKVQRRNSSTPSQAEQVWYSIDQPGGSGTEWNQWWMDVARRAMATGHRWILTEAPPIQPTTRQDEQEGLRPWLVEYSPLDVWNWYFNFRDELEYCVIRFHDEDPRAGRNGLTMRGEDEQSYLLLVREGCDRLGIEFVSGGWWKFTPEKVIYDQGDWADTLGDIPMTVLYYQRHKGTKKTPALSRPGVTELGQAAVALMNQASSANYNSWMSGGGVDYFAGIDEDGYELAQSVMNRGSKHVPLLPNAETDAVPVVYPSGAGAVQAEVFGNREKAIWEAAVRLGVIEAMDDVATGAAGDAGFSATQVPRIIHVAQNLGVAQNNALRWLELRYGHLNPSAEVNWTDRFNLVELVEEIRAFFEIERLSGIRSKTIDAKAMTMAAQEKGLLTDGTTRDEVLAEYEESAERRDEAEIAAASELQNQTMKDPNSTALRDKSREAGKKAAKPGPKQNTGTSGAARGRTGGARR